MPFTSRIPRQDEHLALLILLYLQLLHSDLLLWAVGEQIALGKNFVTGHTFHGRQVPERLIHVAWSAKVISLLALVTKTYINYGTFFKTSIQR